MRYTILFSIFLLAIFIGCSKPRTTPSLKFKSVNTTNLQTGGVIQFTLSFSGIRPTDSIFVQKVVPDCAQSSFGVLYPLPDFPSAKNDKGEVVITFGYNSGGGYQDISPKCQRNDTATFRFALKDNAGHTSDTIASPQIIIYY